MSEEFAPDLTNTAGQHKDECPGVGIIIADSLDPKLVTKVLLMRRGPGARFTGQLESCGGSCEPNEGPVWAALRELKEELGLIPYDIVFLHDYSPKPGKKDYVFIATILGDPVIQESDKCSEVVWVPIAELKDAPLTEYSLYDFRRLGWLPEEK